MEKESIVGKALQGQVQKLIAEEYFAYQLYFFSLAAAGGDEVGVVAELFAKIGEDELRDHLAQLAEWCRAYGVDVPASESEMKKAASKKLQALTSGLKKGQPAGYYLDQAIAQEELAAESYKKALEGKDVCQFTDLQATLWHIYYDEVQHLRDLNTAKIAYEAGDDLVMC